MELRPTPAKPSPAHLSQPGRWLERKCNCEGLGTHSHPLFQHEWLDKRETRTSKETEPGRPHIYPRHGCAFPGQALASSPIRSAWWPASALTYYMLLLSFVFICSLGDQTGAMHAEGKSPVPEPWPAALNLHCDILIPSTMLFPLPCVFFILDPRTSLGSSGHLYPMRYLTLRGLDVCLW